MTERKTERGGYRSIRRVLLDGPDFQALSTAARFTFLALKIGAGPCGLEIEYRKSLTERVSKQTGLRPKSVKLGLDELENGGWISREANLIWIRGHLEHEPTFYHRNPKHRENIQSYVAGLPRLAIVRAFVRDHADWFPPTELATHKLEWVTHTVSDTVSDTVSHTLCHTASSEYRVPSTEERSEGAEQPKPPASLPALPPMAEKLLERFYELPYNPTRYRNVRSQLADALTPGIPGPKIRGGIRVKARDATHLDAVCKAVLDDPPNDRDMAIVFVLKKLTDPPKGPTLSEKHAERERNEIAEQDRYHRALRAAAVTWANANPDEYAKLSAEADAHFRDALDSAFGRQARDAELTQMCGKSAGFPAFDQWQQTPSAA